MEPVDGMSPSVAEVPPLPDSRRGWSAYSPPAALPLAPRGTAARRRRWRATLRLGTGLLLALVVAEVALRATETHIPNPRSPEWSSIAADGPDAPTLTLRWTREGVATSHFSRSRARLTGHPFDRGAPAGLILGDSYVEAANVPDTATMGAVVERLARTSGARLNVRQYGISGASPANYVALADTLRRVWHPAWVAIVVTDDDFDPASLARPPRLEATADGWRLVPDTVPYGRSRVDRVRTIVAHHSWLGYRLLERVARIRDRLGAPSAEVLADPAHLRAEREAGAQAARLAVRALEDAFGPALLVVYVGGVGIRRADDRHRFEDAVREACARDGVRFLSATPLLVDEVEREHRLTRGFANSRPGVGHLNVTGHRVVGTAIWRAVDAAP